MHVPDLEETKICPFCGSGHYWLKKDEIHASITCVNCNHSYRIFDDVNNQIFKETRRTEEGKG